MAKTSTTKLFFFFIFFASVHILDNVGTISAIVDDKVPRNSFLATDTDPCQKGGWKYVKAEVERVEGKCDENDMSSFTNAVTCTRAFLLDYKPYHAAALVSEFHRQNAGRIGFFVEALLHKLDLNPSFIKKCTRKSDREMVGEEYNLGLNLMLEELDKLRIFEENNFNADDEDELEDEDIDDHVEDNGDIVFD